MPAFPDLTQFWMTIYGGYGYDLGALDGMFLGLAAGIPQTGNPPYTINDFLAMYPKFFGTPTVLASVFTASVSTVPVLNITGLAVGQLVTYPGVTPGVVIQAVNSSTIDLVGGLTQGSAVITGIAVQTGLMVGQPLSGNGVPIGATIAALDTNAQTVTMSSNATLTDAAAEVMVTANSVTLSAAPTTTVPAIITVYTAQLVPLFIIQTYINLAYASLMSSRWREAWIVAMGFYVAHFLTLYMQSDGRTSGPLGQAVASGLQAGITVSESADGVSWSGQILSGLQNWGAWQLTSYGVQLITMARAVGAGLIYVR